MLVLTRKIGENIRIGNDIVLSVVECSHGCVKLGITAPLSVPIYREELYKRIVEENRASLIKDDMDVNLFNNLIKDIPKDPYREK